MCRPLATCGCDSLAISALTRRDRLFQGWRRLGGGWHFSAHGLLDVLWEEWQLQRKSVLRSAMDFSFPAVNGRSCGTCTLCCRLPDIDYFEKPADEWCKHCVAGQGCSIYSARPEVCRQFVCLWLVNETLCDEWEPARSKMMVYRQGGQITVLADPDFPDQWRHEPYMSQLQAWAADAAPSGGYVVVFWRDQVIKI